MENKLSIIQFIHPGGEHIPDNDLEIGWNTGDHKRKFMKGRGEYIRNGTIHENNLIFWGEWEPQSTVIEKYPPSTNHEPNYLYSPYYKDPNDKRWKQNSDPFVFGDNFFYSNCKQSSAKRVNQMRYLKLGSLILFGSCIDKKSFVIDTVFIVDSFMDFHTDNVEELQDLVPKEFYDVTLTQLSSKMTCSGENKAAPLDLRLYKGATYDKPINGMFSFFPALPYVTGLKFARPIITLPGVITDNLTQGYKLTIEPNIKNIKTTWDSVVKQLYDQNLALGISVEMPKEDY